MRCEPAWVYNSTISMKNAQQKLETDDLDSLLAEAWPQLNRETQRRLMVYVTRSSILQSSMTRGNRSAVSETAIDQIKNRILATAEKTRVLHGLSRSLKEMAAGDVRPIEDVIREEKSERAQN